MRSEEVRQQAKAEGLALRVADNSSGYFGVRVIKSYQAQVQRGRKTVALGSFATAEEAALCVARSPRRSEEEGQGTPLAMPSRAVHKDAGTVPPMPRGAFIKEEEVVPLMQLLDAVVKWEHAFVADEGGRSEGLPKRRDT